VRRGRTPREIAEYLQREVLEVEAKIAERFEWGRLGFKKGLLQRTLRAQRRECDLPARAQLWGFFWQVALRSDQKAFVHDTLVFFARAFDPVHVIAVSIWHHRNDPVISESRMAKHASNHLTNVKLAHRAPHNPRRWWPKASSFYETKRRKEEDEIVAAQRRGLEGHRLKTKQPHSQVTVRDIESRKTTTAKHPLQKWGKSSAGNQGAVLQVERNRLMQLCRNTAGFVANILMEMGTIQLPKLHTRVRFPSPAPILSRFDADEFAKTDFL
jgi:hypothetical protein